MAALVNARLAQLTIDERRITEQVLATLGPPPPDIHRPQRFIAWCDDHSLPWRPANPSVIAMFVLQFTKLGNLVEELRILSLAHSSQNLPDPCSAYQVTEALARLVKVEPPRSWPKDRQLLFLSLSPDLQQYISERETERDKAVRRSQNDAASWRKHIEQTKSTETNDETKQTAA